MCDWRYLFTDPTAVFIDNERKKREEETNRNINNIKQDTENQIKEMNDSMTNNGEAIQTNPTNKKRNTLSSLRLNMVNTNKNNNTTTGLNI